MTIEHFHGGVVFTGEDVHVFRIHSLRAAMQLELLGIRVTHYRSVIALVRQEFGLTGSRRSVYEQFCTMHQLPVEGNTHV